MGIKICAFVANVPERVTRSSKDNPLEEKRSIISSIVKLVSTMLGLTFEADDTFPSLLPVGIWIVGPPVCIQKFPVRQRNGEEDNQFMTKSQQERDGSHKFNGISSSQSNNVSTRNGSWTKKFKHSFSRIYHRKSCQRCVCWITPLCPISL